MLTTFPDSHTHHGPGSGQLGAIALHYIHKGQQHVLLDGHEGVTVRGLEVEGDVDAALAVAGRAGKGAFVNVSKALR